MSGRAAPLLPFTGHSIPGLYCLGGVAAGAAQIPSLPCRAYAGSSQALRCDAWVIGFLHYIALYHVPDVALVIYNDDILSDEASWIKDIKLSDDERTFHEEYATAHPTHAQDEHNVDTLPPFVPLHPSSSLVSMPLDLPTFASDASVVVHNNNFLFDEAEHEYDIDTLPPFFPFHTSSSPVSQSMSLDLPIFASTCNHEPACTTPDKHEHHGDFNILPVTTTAIDVNYGPSLMNTNFDTDLPLPGSTHPADALAQKPKATHSPRSDQKSLSDKLRSARQQKRKLRASQSQPPPPHFHYSSKHISS